MFVYFVELARSGQAKCKGCGAAIAKGAPRVGINQEVTEAMRDTMSDKSRHAAESPKWHHFRPECVRGFRKMASWWASNMPSIDDIKIVDECVSKEEVQQLLDELAAGPSKKEKEEPTKKDDNDAVVSEEEEEEERPKKRSASAPPAKRARAQTMIDAEAYQGGVIEDEKVELIKAKMNEIKTKTNSYLQGLLKANGQKSTGKKEELVTRVAELSVLGSLPKCPECAKATLHYDRMTGEYACPGSHERGHMVKCAFKSNNVDREDWTEE